MHYKPKSIDALHIALGGLPGHMRIEVEPALLPITRRDGRAAMRPAVLRRTSLLKKKRSNQLH
jgi:hypothetical protein